MEYKKIQDPNERLKKAIEIYKKYLKESTAIFEVNIDRETCNLVKQQIMKE